MRLKIAVLAITMLGMSAAVGQAQQPLLYKVGRRVQPFRAFQRHDVEAHDGRAQIVEVQRAPPVGLRLVTRQARSEAVDGLLDG